MNTRESSVKISAPSLPKGGGAIQGMGEALGTVGMTGMASLTLPLPISAGRGYAPSLALGYSSSAGNGAFGIGWGLSQAGISRRTSAGVPLYQSDDTFLAPDGEIMVPERDANQEPITTQRSSYAGLDLTQTYTVTRYFPNIEGSFSRIEHWEPIAPEVDFWLMHSADGSLFCFGKTPDARIADPSEPGHVGVWLLEESVTPTGEHIVYRYKPENSDNCGSSGHEALRSQSANRYLQYVKYGNVTGYAPLYAWGQYSPADAPEWLFTLVFDYGERSLDALVPPPMLPTEVWPCREDSFSDYAFGFEVRTHRLCHQVLMFNHFPVELGQADTLISRLLLEYQQSPHMTTLSGAQLIAYESDGKVQSQPPIDWSYTTFSTTLDPANYMALPKFPGLNDGQQYQLVDLFGEGLPGVLYQVGNDWRYQAPIRGTPGTNEVRYAPWQPLPELPSLLPESGQRKALVDITGMGRLNWLIAQPNMAGYFTLNPDHSWSTFVPFPAFPVEFLEPTAQMADLVGAGLSDLALIGPKSVRLYANERQQGYGPGQDVAHTSHDRLPIQAGDQASLVAFSDVLGSGQQHLVQIRFNRLTCWPNLGRGRFGQPLVLAELPFDELTFNPSRVYLADLDGSGATDLIYAESDQFLIFMNQSGNTFSQTPLRLPMPAGVRFDQLDQVNFADVNGTGTACLVLTISHIQPQHWCYTFATTKPYLVQTVNNNMGNETRITYRSSAQEWLDEKYAVPGSVCDLPFAFPLVSVQSSFDEVSGNRLTQQYVYRRGVYAGLDREFRGFGFVQHLDTQQIALATAIGLPEAMPALTKVWYHTGQESGELRPGEQPYANPLVFSLGPTRFTRFDPATQEDVPLTGLNQATRYQLFRALKGSVLRKEVYGADSSPVASVPYSVETSRLQVRLLQPTGAIGTYCVALPITLEELSVEYERMAEDPVIQQQINLQVNQFGSTVWNVGVNYARQPQPATNPYPVNVPNEMWSSSYDEGQIPLRITENRANVYNLVTPDIWSLGLPYQQRQNVLTYCSGYNCYPLTAEGLSYEALIANGSLIAPTRLRIFAGQSVTYYFDATGTSMLPPGTPPPSIALVHHQETAELDEESLQAYEGVANLDLAQALAAMGYWPGQKVLAGAASDSSPTIWVIPSGFSTYVENGNWLPFYRPRSTQSTPIVAPQTFTYDVHSCVVTSVTDGFGNQLQAFYDYRFLSPWRTLDANDNIQEVLFDAFGRVIATSYYGSELDAQGAPVAVGFAPVTAFDPNVAALNSIDAALAAPSAAIQGASEVHLYDLYQWMGHISRFEWPSDLSAEAVVELVAVLSRERLLTFSGHVRSRAYTEMSLDMTAQGALTNVERHPVEVATLVADQFPGNPLSQVRISMSFLDGFGRALQAKQKCPPGLAYVVQPDGSLECEAGVPVQRETGTQPRWAVSGRTEYDNKGQAIRTYQPYFVNRPVYVKETDAQMWGYADTHYYDPIGRETAVVTALGYLRRLRFYPWFTVAEDENDTLKEVMDYQHVSRNIS
ncbi:toxin [Pseudomonas atacamensis]|uniref:SpvB/TcaC N-terminal domain-containing protein n=1 Tax=Pseudomonas atacamensis TaxID=2565368 RepID=UPI001C3D946C|nr:SpvB/TcaC N-terminal domain-containing protein [Pseudomonas atacamensis]QXH74806.1 toxin [Pseudomonas atacamensis]